MSSTTTLDDSAKSNWASLRKRYPYIVFIGCLLLFDFFTFCLLIDGRVSDFTAACQIGSIGGQVAFATVLCAFRFRHWILGYTLGVILGFAGFALLIIAAEMDNQNFDAREFRLFLLIPCCVACYMIPLWMMRATQGWYLVRISPTMRPLEPSSIVHIFAFTLVIASTLTLVRGAIRMLTSGFQYDDQLDQQAVAFIGFQLLFGFAISLGTIAAVRAWFLAKTKRRATIQGLCVVTVVWLVPMLILAAMVFFAESDLGEAIDVGGSITISLLVAFGIFYLGLLSLTASGFVMLSKSKSVEALSLQSSTAVSEKANEDQPQIDHSATVIQSDQTPSDSWKTHDVFGESADCEIRDSITTRFDGTRLAITAIISVIVGSAIFISILTAR